MAETLCHAASQIESSYGNQSKDSEVDEFLQAARRRFVVGSGYENHSVYVNFAHGDEGAGAWYGAKKLPKLLDLKHKWDPEAIFSYFNPVPLR